jgi:hypothetical protein
MLRAEFTALLGVEISSQAKLSKMISGGAADQITGVMDSVDSLNFWRLALEAQRFHM